MHIPTNEPSVAYEELGLHYYPPSIMKVDTNDV